MGIVEPAALSPTSYRNWPQAETTFERCKSHENMQDVYRDWVNWYGEESALRMCLILRYESDYRVTIDNAGTNSNGSVDVGLFQVNTPLHCPKVEGALQRKLTTTECRDALRDKAVNVEIARQIYQASGWSPWYGRKGFLPAFWADRVTVN